MSTTVLESEPGRVSVVGKLAGTGGGRSLMLYAHHDTVGTSGMEGDPFSGEVRGGRLYGRGAYDMKGSLASCMAAVKGIVDAGVPLRGDLYVAAVADEEVASIGTQEVLRSFRPDGAIVTEPTELRLCLAHKGFSWIEVQTFGRAAHGSRFDEGVDANMHMGRFLARLGELERDLRSRTGHPLLGPPSLHAAVLRGGTGTSTYAEHCRLEIERRTVPGETEESVLGEIAAIADALGREDDAFRAEVRAFLTRPSFETDDRDGIARVVGESASQVTGAQVERVGVAYWMDTALFAAGGVDTVCFGPAGAGAHAAVEWVDVDSLCVTAEVLARSARAYCG
jgi:acetylornithine deacetylase